MNLFVERAKDEKCMWKIEECSNTEPEGMSNTELEVGLEADTEEIFQFNAEPFVFQDDKVQVFGGIMTQLSLR